MVWLMLSERYECNGLLIVPKLCVVLHGAQLELEEGTWRALTRVCVCVAPQPAHRGSLDACASPWRCLGRRLDRQTCVRAPIS